MYEGAETETQKEIGTVNLFRIHLNIYNMTSEIPICSHSLTTVNEEKQHKFMKQHEFIQL